MKGHFTPITTGHNTTTRLVIHSITYLSFVSDYESKNGVNRDPPDHYTRLQGPYDP